MTDEHAERLISAIESWSRSNCLLSAALLIQKQECVTDVGPIAQADALKDYFWDTLNGKAPKIDPAHDPINSKK